MLLIHQFKYQNKQKGVQDRDTAIEVTTIQAISWQTASYIISEESFFSSLTDSSMKVTFVSMKLSAHAWFA